MAYDHDYRLCSHGDTLLFILIRTGLYSPQELQLRARAEADCQNYYHPWHLRRLLFLFCLVLRLCSMAQANSSVLRICRLRCTLLSTGRLRYTR